MEKYDLPYFGPIDLTDIKDSYRTAAEFANRKLSLDLNFDKKQISRDVADSIKTILLNIGILDQHNLQFIKQGEVPMTDRLLNQLRLIRIGLYPYERSWADYFGVFDYSIDIDGEPCNQLLVVRTNNKGVPFLCDWES